ncbi:MAG: arginine--tRNA ligase [Rhodospirillales bacterium]|nr:arginine--tRNA ligase [Rhodospirillales bacterium]
MTQQDIFAAIRAEVLAALGRIIPELPAEIVARVEVQPARDAAHGDMASNAAMVAARAAGRKPAEIAAELATALAALPAIDAATPAGPGFVNLRLAPTAWHGVVRAALAAGNGFGDSTLGAGQAVNVEYVSANPTGPMHIGHCRGAVVGDALAALLAKVGFAVTREYYINDAGAQVAALAWAAYWRYLQALGTTMTEEEYAALVPGGLQYRGEYLIAVGEALLAAHGPALAGPDATPAPPALWLATVRETAVAMMMASIREDLALLGVTQDVFSSERALVAAGAVDRAIATLDAKGLIYEGVLEPPRGKTPDDWEARPQTLFRSTQFGDDVDRPLRKSDGSNTYFSNDIAYHADKAGRGFPLLIDIWGADHGGYVARMAAAVTAITGGAAKLEVVLCQIVRVMRGGEPVRMSKRAGSYVTLRDLIEEVGRDAVRFIMLTRKSDAQMDFDLDQAVAQTRENPVFYVQYAHARCRSVLRAAAEAGVLADGGEAALAEADLALLDDAAELALMRRMGAFPRLVEAAALAREPHRIAFFLYDLASDFHMLWNRGKEDATLRFIRAEQPQATRARLALVAATVAVLRAGLAVLGVTPMEELR